MSAIDKRDPAEWKAFIATLEPGELVEAAEQANSAPWVNMMIDEGATADQVQGVLMLFAERFRKLGFAPPKGGYVDLGWLVETFSKRR